MPNRSMFPTRLLERLLAWALVSLGVNVFLAYVLVPR